MAMIWFLKALADICIYYLFAAPLAGFFGSTGLILCALLQAAAYAIARCAKKKWPLALSVALVLVSYGLCLACPADLVVQTPALVYLILQFKNQVPLPALIRQRENFRSSWKPMLIAAFIAFVLEGFSVFLLFALTVFAANVAFLRTLRHSPQAYLRPGFQLMNLGILACVPLTAFLLGTGPVAKAVSTGVGWFYKELLLPAVMRILSLPGQLLQKLIDYLRPLINIEPDTVDNTLPQETMESRPEDVLSGSQEVPPAWQVIEIILLVLLAVGAVIGMILLFRKLGKGDKSTAQSAGEPEIRTSNLQKKSHAPVSDTPAVQAVRKHYRRYLKLCVKSGIPVQPSSTSDEVQAGAAQRKALQPHAGRIRQLYIRARYAGLATNEDAKEMGRLCARSKKEK